jgi:hypothetical protein
MSAAAVTTPRSPAARPFSSNTSLRANSTSNRADADPGLVAEPAPAGGVGGGAEIEVVNRMTRGAVNVNAFSAGKLIAAKWAVAPAQKAVFRFTPVLWIGAASQVQEGRALSSAVLSSDNTMLPLAGIAAADIVMTGGGGGADAQPFGFALENVVHV